MFRAQRGLISKSFPSSTMRAITLCTSYACRALSGMIRKSSSSRRSAGSEHALRGGFSPARAGKNDRYSRTAAMQAASLSHSRSATPLTSVWTFDPPSASSVTSSPTTLFTRYGPPIASDEVPRTIGTKSARPGM